MKTKGEKKAFSRRASRRVLNKYPGTSMGMRRPHHHGWGDGIKEDDVEEPMHDDDDDDDDDDDEDVMTATREQAREISMAIASEGSVEYFCCNYASPKSYGVEGTPLGDAWQALIEAHIAFERELEAVGGTTDECEMEQWED